jgi:aminopeptidase
MNRYLPPLPADELQHYADLVIHSGVALYPGQKLIIGCGVADYGFALLLADSAYRAGAAFVKIDAGSNYMAKSRIAHSRDDHLSWLPEYLTARYNEQLADDWALIRIDNTSEMEILQGVDSDKLDTISRALSVKARLLRQHMSRHHHTWCVIASPNAWWADQVLSDESGDRLTALWEVIRKVMRLDRPDPAAAWREHTERLDARCSRLNSAGLDRLHFKGPGTDLHVGLSERSQWLGGSCMTPDGRVFIPNMPTEEIFTTPDWRRTEGKVSVTRPVKVMETLVEGAWFHFKNGRVTDFGADSGLEVLKKYLEVDDGASFAGEIALVDSGSPIFQSGYIFSSILYDENASCHIALGNGYPTGIRDGEKLRSNEELREAGCNVSLVHRDFMIGSSEVSVTGLTTGDDAIEIIRNGSFVE